MKIYPHQNQSNKLNKYQLNIHHINQISHYQPIPSIPALSEDFNFTFLIKDYDQANPYLKKNSTNRKSGNNQQSLRNQSLNFQQNLLDFYSFGNSGSPVLIKKQNKKQKLTLPNINNQIHSHRQKDHNKKIKLKQKERQNQRYRQKQIQNEKNIRYNKSATIDTRIQTDQMTIQDQPSTSSLLKIETKSLSKSIDASSFSHLKISKITNPEKHNQRHHTNFLQRNNLLSRDISEFSRLVSISPTKSIDHQYMIEEQDSTGQQSQQQFVKDSVPGPGYYSISHHSSFSKPSINSVINRKGSTNFNFGSSQSRFKEQNKGEQNLQYYKLKLQQYELKQKQRQQKLIRLNKKQKKIVPFNSKQESKQFPDKRNMIAQQFISPHYYNPRYGIEQELIKKIQKNFKGSFGVGQKRFRTIYRRSYDVGPGSYSLDMKSIQQDEIKKQAYYFMSKKQRFQ